MSRGGGLGLDEVEVFYRRHGPAVLRRCQGLLSGDEHAAWDAMHQTFTRAIRYRGSYRRDADPIRWLFAIAYRVCMDQLRASSRMVSVPEVTPNDLAGLDGAVADARDFSMRLDQQRTVALLLPMLDDNVREIVVMRYFDELEIKAIAEQTGSSERTVARRLSRFIERAHTLLERRR